jgi:hypothetical protein
MMNLTVLTALAGGGLRIIAGWRGVLVGSSQAMG